MSTKFCSQCNVEQDTASFRYGKTRCKKCLQKNRDVWAKKNRDKIRGYKLKNAEKHFEKRKRELENPYHKAKVLVRAAKNRAKRSDQPCEITWSWVLERMIQNEMCCEATGVRFDFTALPYVGQGQRNPLSPSLDKISPELGYTEENTQVVCWFYNLAKSNFDERTVWRIMRAAVKFRGGA